MRGFHSGLAVAAVCLCTLTSTADAETNYPTQQIKIVVPWAPGGTTDVLARMLAKSLTTSLGQSVYVENVAGAGGNIGTQQFVRTKPDGYTLLMASGSTNAANPHLYNRLGFDPVKDFTPIAMIGRVPSVLVVADTSPYKTYEDLATASRTRSANLTYASGGVGSSAHLAGELLKNLTDFQATHVPYRGTGPAMADVMGRQVTFMFDTGVSGFIESGKVKPLAVAASARVAALPDVPTFEELGIKGMIMNAWFGVAAPANTPAAIVRRVNEAIGQALASGEIADRLRQLGSDTAHMTIDEFSAFWIAEIDRYAQIVPLTGAKLD